MKTILSLIALTLLFSSCGLQPDPSWAPSNKPQVEARTMADIIHPNNLLH